VVVLCGSPLEPPIRAFDGRPQNSVVLELGGKFNMLKGLPSSNSMTEMETVRGDAAPSRSIGSLGVYCRKKASLEDVRT
jgi:hypothetical protein